MSSKGKILNRSGQKFGHLTVLGQWRRTDSVTFWFCRCECGTEKFITGGNLVSGSVTSCGCERFTKITKHGASRHPERKRLYGVWKGMRKRCNNPNDKPYHHYGGRGIKVCEAWGDFSVFEADMGPTYQPGLEIDRIDNDGGYSKGNCRWATREQQTNNTRRNAFLIHEGQTLTVSQWARKLGLNRRSLHCRVFRHGWSHSMALTKNIHKIPAPNVH